MSNLTIYNGQNSQLVTLVGLADSTGTVVNTATITGQLLRNGSNLDGGDLTFAAVDGVPGSFQATLNAFDAPTGKAELVITGSNAGVTFKYIQYVTIAERSI